MPFDSDSTDFIEICKLMNPLDHNVVAGIAKRDTSATKEDILLLFTSDYFGEAFSITSYFQPPDLRSSAAKRSDVLVGFLENKVNPNNHFSYEELREFVHQAGADINRVAPSFFSSSENPYNNYENLRQATGSITETAYGNSAGTCFLNYLKFTRQPIKLGRLTELVREMQPFLVKQSEFYQGPLASFFSNEINESNRVNFREFAKVLVEFPLKKYQQTTAIRAFLENPNNPNNLLTIEELKELLRSCEIKEIDDIGDVLKSYFSRKTSHNAALSIDEFFSIFQSSEAGLGEAEQIAQALKIYLSSTPLESLDKQAFGRFMCKAIRSLNIVYDFSEILDFISKFEEDIFDFEIILHIANELYATNEVVRTQFMTPAIIDELQKQATGRRLEGVENYRQLSADDFAMVRSFLQSLSNDVAIELLQNLQDEAANADFVIGERDLFLLTKGRAHSRYKALVEAFGEQKGLSDVFTPEFVASCEQKFGADFLKQNAIDAVDVLSYLDLNNGLADFNKFVKPSIMAKFSRNFSANPANLLLSGDEVRKIHQILSGNARFSEAELQQTAQKFTANAQLCDFFLSKIGDIPAINLQAEYQLDFSGTGHEEKADDTPHAKETMAQARQELTRLFNKILREKDPSTKDVLDFFSKTFNLMLDEISDSENMRDFFKDNRAKIAHVFCVNPHKRSGLATPTFVSLLMKTLVDGCSKNISSQFGMAFGAMFLQEDCDRILYQVLCQTIIPKIINNRADIDAIETGDFLTNKVARSYYLGPQALLNKVAAQFYYDGERGEIDSWSIIEAKLGPETRSDLLDFLSKEVGQDAIKLEERSAKIAAQITLIATIGEAEAQKTGFHETYLNILRNAKIWAEEKAAAEEREAEEDSSKEKGPKQETRASSAQRASGGAAAAASRISQV